MDELQVQQAHGLGPTYLNFAPNGLALYTAGNDCLVRIFRMDEAGKDEEPKVADESDESINCVAASNQLWLSGSSDSLVRQYDAGQSKMTSLFTRTPGVPVRAIAFDPKGEKVAIASDELTIKVIPISDSTQVTLLEGHSKGVRKITWHPDGNLLTSTSSDGRIIVWDTSTAEIVHTIEGIIPAIANQEANEFCHDCSVVWHPEGTSLYLPSMTHDIVRISSSNWEKTGNLSDPDSSGAITALCISANGLYLAAATASNQILIYSTTIQKVLYRQTSQAVAINVAFSPSQNLLVWTALDGTLTRWSEPIPSDMTGPTRKITDQKSTTFDEDVGGGLDVDADYDDDNWMIDDLDGKFKDESKPANDNFTREMVSVTKAQLAFQSGATPMQAKRRYLAFNGLGVIEVTDQEDYNLVNVDFHDRSTRKPYHFQDTFKYELASLGERGALYACGPQAGHPARIEYKPYATWSSTSEWSFDLPPGESTVALAAGGAPASRSLRDLDDEDIEGNGMAIVGTNLGYLRFFTGGGLQSYIWSLGEDIIGMVAGREWVFVVHREGGTSLDGCQNLKYSLIAFDSMDYVQQGRLPLPKGRFLRWIGISEEGAPAMFDSSGLLLILDRFRQPSQARWVPVLDTNNLARKQGKDESYWPVGLSSSKFMCLILKGRQEHPGFPRPLVQELEIQIPLLSFDHPATGLEESYLRESLFTGMLRDSAPSDVMPDGLAKMELSLDKALIQLIQLACKESHLQRALDCALLLNHGPSFDGAAKIAGFYQLLGLQEKFGKIKEHKLMERHNEWPRRRNLHKPPPIEEPYANGSSAAYQQHGMLGRRRPVKLADPYAEPIVMESTEIEDSQINTTSNTSFEPLPSSVALGKRKQTNDETQLTDFGDEAPVPDAKRRLTLTESQPSTQPAATGGNPFAKKSQTKDRVQAAALSHTRSLSKTNSFFDKVDNMDVDVTQKEKGRPRANVKKNDTSNSKQTTLFSSLPGLSTVSNGKRDKVHKAELPTETQETTGFDGETQETLVDQDPE